MGGRNSATFCDILRPLLVNRGRQAGAPAPGVSGIPFDRLRTGFNRHGRGIGALVGGAGVAPGLVRSRRAGAWIPVSGYGNDGARRAHGSMDSPPAPLAQHGSASLPHLNPRPLGRRLNGGGEGAWIPVSGHGNDSTRRLWLHGLAARATSAARERVAPPPTSILPLWGGGQTAARKGHGFPCRGT